MAGLASGTLVDGCGGLSVSSPMMASICGATEDETSGADVLSYPVFPEERRYFEIGVEKADWTWATVPETGSDKPVADGVPTVRPCARRLDVTCAIVPGVGPNSSANCVGRQEVAVVGRLWIGYLLRLCRQRGGIAWLERDGERQSRRCRCGPDEGGPGGNEALMAGQPLAPGSGGDSARRGGDTERRRAGEHHGEPEHARDDEAQPTNDTSIHLHLCVLTGAPRVGKGNAPTRAIFSVCLLLGTRLTGVCPIVVPSLSAPVARALGILGGMCHARQSTRAPFARKRPRVHRVHLCSSHATTSGAVTSERNRSARPTRRRPRASGARAGNLEHGSVPPPLRPGSHRASYRVSTR